MSKSQSRELFACDNARVVTTGLSLLTAGAGLQPFQKNKKLDLLLNNSLHTDALSAQ